MRLILQKRLFHCGKRCFYPRKVVLSSPEQTRKESLLSKSEFKDFTDNAQAFSREKDHDMETAAFKPVWMQQLMDLETKAKDGELKESQNSKSHLSSVLKDRHSDEPISVQEIEAHLTLNGVERVSILDMKEKSTWTEWFIFAYVSSGRQLNAISESLIYQFKHRPKSLDLNQLIPEGTDSDGWILLDFGSFVVHLMTKEAEEHYQLEHLWAVERKKISQGFDFYDEIEDEVIMEDKTLEDKTLEDETLEDKNLEDENPTGKL